jgi:hypothetical protein
LSLKRLYRSFNALYFGGELPDAEIRYEPVPAFADCCKTDDVFVIRINPAIGGWVDFLKLTLLHEMIHVRLWPRTNHGVRFDREVERLMQFKEIRKLI